MVSNSDQILIETQYLPPIETFSRWAGAKGVWVEAKENFVKASYRNRARICGANGLIDLSIPIAGGRSQRSITEEVKLVESKRWQRIHWQSIVSAYGSSPFFEHYGPDLAPFYQQSYTYLLDFNMALLEKLLELLEMDLAVERTLEYAKEPDDTEGRKLVDLRGAVHPSALKALPSKQYTPPVYQQVFGDRYPFIPNLSVIDLLFNCGPSSRSMILAATSLSG